MSEAIIKINMDKGCEDLFPKKSRKGDAAFDLRSSVDCELKFNEIKAIDAGFSMELEEGYESQIRPRSGLALKYGLMVVNSPGTIDENYRGKICVILKYTGGGTEPNQDSFSIKRGDRIAQMVINEVPSVLLVPSDNLSNTDRGTNGFGSSGVK